MTAVTRGDAVAVVTGPTGVGKTLLCKAIVDRLDPRTVAALVDGPAATFDELTRMVAADFGVATRDQLRALVSSLPSRQANAVIVVDEAQNVPPDVLNALCGFAQEARGALQIVLAGQPALTRLVNRPESRALHERVGEWAELGPLAVDEVGGYVAHRVNVASPNPRIDFDSGAFDRLYELSFGMPRTINQVCDRALIRAFAESAATIDRRAVDAAAWELGLRAAPRGREAFRRAAIGVGFLLLMTAGGAAAAWLFRDRVYEILRRWLM